MHKAEAQEEEAAAEPLPLVGLGSWITFNVGNDRGLREQSFGVMRAFFEAGGRMIDSSPMYGSSQDVIGAGLERLAHRARFSRPQGVDRFRVPRPRADRRVPPAVAHPALRPASGP